jgi:small subunit ribosomal protein S20
VANIKSQIKRNRTNEKARLRNKSTRSEVKTRIKKAVALAGSEPGSEQAIHALRMAAKRLDKAAAKGIIHKNQAANRKSRLARRINALSGSAGPEAGGDGGAG